MGGGAAAGALGRRSARGTGGGQGGRSAAAGSRPAPCGWEGVERAGARAVWVGLGRWARGGPVADVARATMAARRFANARSVLPALRSPHITEQRSSGWPHARTQKSGHPNMHAQQLVCEPWAHMQTACRCDQQRRWSQLMRAQWGSHSSADWGGGLWTVEQHSSPSHPVHQPCGWGDMTLRADTLRVWSACLHADTISASSRLWAAASTSHVTKCQAGAVA
jgi:hypothetical protein